MHLLPGRSAPGARLAAATFVVAIILGACASSATSAPIQNVGAPIAPSEAGKDSGPQAGNGAGAGTSPGGPGQRVDQYGNDLAPTGPLIIRTGTISVQVGDLDAALARAQEIVTAAGGYISAGQRTGDGERATASVTYRIPAAAFDATLTALRAVGSKLLAEQISSDEVTSQVVDLAARLTNLRASEAALQKIMEQATKIPDILEVQAQLTTTRDEIERLVAQKQTLEQQAALATLTVTYSLPATVAVETVQQGWDPAGVVDRAAATMVSLGQGLVEVAIWLGIVVLPILLVLGVPTVLVVAWRRRRSRNRPKAQGPAGPPEASALWPAG